MTFFFSILLLFLIGGQQHSYKTIATIPATGDKTILTDKLNNFYILSQGTLTKYTPFGKKVSSFSDGSLGDITSADVTNSNHIILYYDNFNQILFLDDALSIMAEPVLLDNYKLFSVRAVSYSPDDGFFLFDEDTYTVKHFNQSLKEDYESISLYNFLKNYTDSMQLFFRANRLFLFQPTIGLLVFDEIGNFLMQISLPGKPVSITIGQTALFYKNDRGIPIVFSLTSGQTETFDILQSIDFNAFVETTNNIIIAEKDEIIIQKK